MLLLLAGMHISEAEKQGAKNRQRHKLSTRQNHAPVVVQTETWSCMS